MHNSATKLLVVVNPSNLKGITPANLLTIQCCTVLIYTYFGNPLLYKTPTRRSQGWYPSNFCISLHRWKL